MCLVHEKLICDCDKKLQVAKNIHRKESVLCTKEQNTELKPSAALFYYCHQEIIHHSLFLKQQGENLSLFFFNVELFEQILEVCLC